MSDGEILTRFDEIEPELRGFIANRVFRDPSHELDDSLSLVSDGLIDSMSLVEILAFLERILSVTIPARRVSPQDFEGVAAIRKMIHRLFT